MVKETIALTSRGWKRKEAIHVPHAVASAGPSRSVVDGLGLLFVVRPPLPAKTGADRRVCAMLSAGAAMLPTLWADRAAAAKLPAQL